MSETLVTPQDVVDLIRAGDLDSYLPAISAAIKQRQSLVQRKTAVSMNAGDQFYIQNVSPKYLVGALVEFIEYIGGVAPVRVKFVYDVRQYRAGRCINLRESHIGAQR